MVSIRKRRHLGIQERYKILSQLSRLNACQNEPEVKMVVEKKNTFHGGNMNSLELSIERKPVIEVGPNPSVCIDGSSSKDINNTLQGIPLRSRKPSRRKQAENQDTCMLRGVYYKNMKWQAAIKVDKKQIHLGTVASMEEAAHLYDRAAYLCGRVPNFELSEEEKQELRGLQWEEFLLLTKEAIASKKKRKRVETCLRRRQVMEEGEMDTQSFYQLDTQSFHEPIAFDENELDPESFNHASTTFSNTLPYYYTTSFHPTSSLQEVPLQANSPIH